MRGDFGSTFGATFAGAATLFLQHRSCRSIPGLVLGGPAFKGNARMFLFQFGNRPLGPASVLMAAGKVAKFLLQSGKGGRHPRHGQATGSDDEGGGKSGHDEGDGNLHAIQCSALLLV